jgi:hypothetical protein
MNFKKGFKMPKVKKNKKTQKELTNSRLERGEHRLFCWLPPEETANLVCIAQSLNLNVTDTVKFLINDYKKGK